MEIPSPTGTPAAQPPTPEESFDQRKARLKSESAAGPSPTPPVEKQAPAVPNGESAGAPAAPKQEPQEKGKPRKEETAEERAAKLRAAGRVTEADAILEKARKQRDDDEWLAKRDDTKRQLEEFEALKRRPAEPPPPPKPEPAATPPTEKRLTRAEFFALPENATRTYDEVQEAWTDKRDEYRKADLFKEWEERQQQNSRQRTFAEKVGKAQKDHPDFDAKVKGIELNQQNLHSLITEFDNGLEVLYHLGNHPDVYQTVKSLSPAMQMVELGILSRELAKPPQQPGQQPTAAPPAPVPISRTPAPPRRLSGVGEKDEEAETGIKPGETFDERKARLRSKAG